MYVYVELVQWFHFTCTHAVYNLVCMFCHVPANRASSKTQTSRPGGATANSTLSAAQQQQQQQLVGSQCP